MPGSVSTRLATLAAIYVLYLLVFLGFGPEVMGPWGEMIVGVLTTLVAAWAASRTRGTVRSFFALFALASLFDSGNLALLRLDEIRVAAPAWNAEVGSNSIPLSWVFFGLFLFAWNCAWGLRVLRLFPRQRNASIHFVSALILTSFVFLYALQFRSFDLDVLDAEQRFSTLFLVLELTGILLGLLSVVMGVGRPYLLMVVGFGMYAAADIVVTGLRLHESGGRSDDLDPLWMLGRMLIFGGVLVLPHFDRDPEARPEPHRFGRESGRHSALSAVLMVFSLGSVFIAAVVTEVLDVEPHWLALFFVLFAVVSVVLLSTVTRQFDETVAYTRDWIDRLFERQLRPRGWRDAPRNVRTMLGITSLDSALDSAEKAAQRLSEDVVFLGPERLNRPASRLDASTGVAAFVVMPFGADWSDQVHGVIRTACKAHHVRAVRGDDIFTPTDILDDIWREIAEADFVIADITGRNTNVFYELGMAHAIGKPVIILSQSPEDVPIDLKTRRVLMYDGANTPDLEAKLVQAIAEVVEKYGFGEVPPELEA